MASPNNRWEPTTTPCVCLNATLAAAVLVLLVACATPTRPAGSVVSNPAAPKGTRYICEGDRSFSVEYYSGGATLYMTGQALKLGQVPSASGTKYSDGAMTLWTKGADATLLFNGAPFYKSCRMRK